ncbi:homocysteine S-methyltransferase family protein [Geomesophilobacter sediminis]|uniref:Homocysteine S-methyltransferase family protein n=1 Tax=Geomesophilobacter sediminis TaxID=2798584 RepID=A0A8J7JFN2_9BACT|nr:homocysteine S-methyltransferase family protein [Geomesophilobacter sediminis]MBJ6725169.1 homocysteine S-methyltransferase family protein [Geomesophilobacter sediminis]
MNFAEFLDRYPCILGEGALIERLRRREDLELDPFVVNSAFIYEEAKRGALEALCRDYLDIGCEFGLPLLMSTPTWRASRERIAAAGLEGRDLNADNAAFLDRLRESYGGYAEKILICGLMSCKGNAYEPAEALSVQEAAQYHAWQAERLAATKVDFLLAATLPALSEATGLALALAATGKPYVVSFVVRPAGTLLDGTPLKDAIAAIDGVANPKPIGYLINCTHASFARAALLDETNSSPEVRRRMIGLLANTAALSPEELDESAELVEEDPEVFGSSVAGLRDELGLKILGGCCGTDGRHIRALAERLR